MRVLVTGGTGFVGSHTARALRAAGHDVRLLVRSPEKVRRVFGADGRELPAHARGDVADEASVQEALRGCDAVVHAAARVSLRARDARAVLETNARGVEHVVAGAVRRGLPSVVYVSSVGALFRPDGAPLHADAPVAGGRTAYARSKADAERAVRALQERGAPVRITYPTGVLGPDDPGLSETNHGLRAMLRDLMIVTSGGFQAVDVRDLAALHVRLVEQGAGPARSLAAGHYFSWSDLLRLLEELTGRRLRRLHVPGTLLRVAGRAGDLVKRAVDFDFPLTSESMTFATLWRAIDDAGGAGAAPGVRWRPPHETYADALRWMHGAGHLAARHVGKLAAA
jgi:nucleoside-diphosphate-sugar epimerase